MGVSEGQRPGSGRSQGLAVDASVRGMMELIVEAGPDAVVVVDGDGRLVVVNARAAELFGYEQDELLGRCVDELVPESMRGAHAAHRSDYGRNPSLRHMNSRPELWGRRKDGTEFPAEVSLGPVELDGEMLVIAAIRDATTRRRAELERESAERLRLALQGERMIAWEHDLESDELIWVGSALEDVIGIPADEFAGTFTGFLELVHPDDRAALQRAIGERLEGKQTTTELRLLLPDGSVRWIMCRAGVVRNEDGAPVRMRGAWSNITERKLAEFELETRARQQSALVALGRSALAGTALPELMEEAVTALAATLDVEYAKVQELLRDGSGLLLRAGVGWQEGLVGSAIVPGQRVSQAGYTLLQKGPVIVDDLATETRFTGPQLLHDHGVVSGVTVLIEGTRRPYGVLGVHTTRRRSFDEGDVSFLQAVALVLSEAIERHGAEGGLRRSLDLLRQSDSDRRRLLDRLVRAQEDERRRIASDVHDDSVQVLTALLLRLELLRRNADDEDLASRLVEIEETARASIARLRHLIFELQPPALDEEGLTAALRALLDEIRTVHGLDCQLDAQLELEPDPQTRSIVYRIAQEALTNVVKHARATWLRVELSTSHHGVLTRVVDDGSGFPLESRRDGEVGHLGLTSMRERAEMANGRWGVESAGGSGTTVEFWIPDSPRASLGRS